MLAAETENTAWVDRYVEEQRARGGAFRTSHGVWRRLDGLSYAWDQGALSRAQLSAGRRYARDYSLLHQKGKYRCTIYRFMGHEDVSPAAAVQPARNLALARSVLTHRQRVLCDAVCGEDAYLVDPDLTLALEALADHYGGGYRPEDDFRVFRPAEKIAHGLRRFFIPEVEEVEQPDELEPAHHPALSAVRSLGMTIQQFAKQQAGIARALKRLEDLKKQPAPVSRHRYHPAPLAAAEPDPVERAWDRLLPAKPSRSDDTMAQSWLAEAGVVKANRDMRHLGVQAKAAVKRKARAKGRKRRPRRAGNS